MMKTLLDALEKNAVTYQDKVAIQTKKETITYKQLWEKVKKYTGYFKTKGVKRGDRVILEAISGVDYIVTYLAMQRLGAITGPVERGVKEDKLRYVADLLDATVYISKKDARLDTIRNLFYDTIDKEAEIWNMDIEPDPLVSSDISEIIFTTGTTGNPKAAMHSVEGICCNTSNTIHGIGMRETDCILLPLPLNHSFGMRVMRSALEIGATIVLQSGALFADALIDNIKKYSCNAMACVSATMESVLKEIGEEKLGKEFGALRYIEFSAGAVPKGMRKKLIELLPHTEIHNTWGSSETGGCLFLNVQDRPDKIGAVGRALEHITLAIYDEEKDTFLEGTGKGTVGRLAIRGEMIFKGYWKQDDVYAETVKDGWFRTNDLVWRDEDNYYYILGRADDVINVGGEKIAPSEIENAVFDCEGVDSCACIGIPDTEGVLGEVPLLLYVKNKDKEITEKELAKIISSKIGVYKTPKKFVAVGSIPKNYMKKTDYKRLKKIYRELGVEGFAELAEQKKEAEISYVLNNEVVKTILTRKSKRKFTEDDVPQDIVEMLVKVGASAPSGKNLQTRRFTIVNDREEIQDFKQVVKKVASEKATSFHGFENPPLLILISNDRRNRDGIQDVGVAAENIMIAAESYGLGSVWLNPLMDISDEPAIRQRLDAYKIPKNHIVWAVMAIGWPSEPAPEFYRKPNEIYYVK